MAEYSLLICLNFLILWVVFFNLLIVTTCLDSTKTSICEICVQTKYSEKETCIFLEKATAGPRCTKNVKINSSDKITVIRNVSHCETMLTPTTRTSPARTDGTTTTTTTTAPTTTVMTTIATTAPPPTLPMSFFNPAALMTPGGLLTIIFMPTVIPPTAATTTTTPTTTPFPRQWPPPRLPPNYMSQFQPPSYYPDFESEFTRSTARGRSMVYFFGGMALTFAISAVGYIISRLNEAQRKNNGSSPTTIIVVKNHTPGRPNTFHRPKQKMPLNYGDGY